jgi:hypothetical protein
MIPPIGAAAIVEALTTVINVTVESMPQTKEQLHQMYVDYIKELRRLKAEKYGEQLEFQFEETAVIPAPAQVPQWRNKQKNPK